MARPYVSEYPKAVKLSDSAFKNLTVVQVNYAYTGVMEIATGVIDLCAAAGTNPHYATVTPKHTLLFPQVIGKTSIPPIVHGGPGGSSHEILSSAVASDRSLTGSFASDGFCGFTVRFNDKPVAEFSGTSRSLNSADKIVNGELEEALRIKMMACLAPVISLYGWTTLTWAPPRTNPQAAAAQRAVGIPGGLMQNGVAAMLASIKARKTP